MSLRRPCRSRPGRVRLVTSDAHAGLVEAIAANLPGASWQHCRTTEQTDEWAEGRRYLGLDVLTRCRLTTITNTVEEVTEPLALTA